jgi:tetratricopeptide (TPR) repeat protein/putative methionine-R-sulfoxide reductase with GAF domain
VSGSFIAAIRAAFDTDERGILDALWLARWMPAPAAGADSGAVRPPVGTGEASPRGTSPSAKDAAHAVDAAKTAQPTGGSKAAGSMYAGAANAGAGEPFVPVRPVRIPAGAALPQGLDMVRGFRPLPRRAPSRIGVDLDEEATAEATAQNSMRVLPVMRPQQERWFEAALVVEHTASMEIWLQTVTELERMLQYTGSFRDVRTYWLHTHPKARLIHESGAESRIESLRDPQARRIVFLFSAGTSHGWTDGSMGRALNCWAASIPVVLVHALPQRLWKNTNLGEPVILVNNPTPGGSNSQLHRQRAWWARRRVFDGERCVLPVFSLDRASAQRWAQMIVARRGTTAPAFLARTMPAPPMPESAAAPALSPRERVSQFRGNSSPEAFRLAVHLAAGPFTLPVVQLVQNSFLGGAARQSQVAEVMLSGLVERVTAPGARIPPDQVVFRFQPGAQAVLLESLRDDDARGLAGLMQDYIAAQLGRPDDLVVRLPDPEGKERLPASAEPFARLKKSLLDRLGLASEAVPVIVPSSPEPGRVKEPAPIWPIQRPLRNIAILWVDDHPANIVGEAEQLVRMGALVATRTSTKDALTELRQRPYDVIITGMARGSEPEAGLDFLGELRRQGVSLPAIVYAAQWAGAPEAEERAFVAGALGCTNSWETLLELVLRAANRSALTERYLNLMGEIGFDDVDALGVIRLPPDTVAEALTERARDIEHLYRVLTIAVDAIAACDYVQLFLGETKLKLAADHVGRGKTQYPEASDLGVIGNAHHEARTWWVPNVVASPVYIYSELTTSSELAIPVLADNKRSVGVLNLESPEKNAFTAEQIQWLEALVAAYPLPRRAPSAFLIHAEQDTAVAQQLERALTGFGVRTTRRASRLRDSAQRNIASKSGVVDPFESGTCFVLLLSPSAVSSAWFQSDVERALARRASGGEKVYIISAVIESCDLPASLWSFQTINISSGMPRAADDLMELIEAQKFHPPWRPRAGLEAAALQGAKERSEAAARRGDEAFQREDYDEAVAAFTEAIGLTPQAEIYRRRALAYWYWHHYPEAIADYNSVLRLDPGLEERVWFGRGQVLAEAGQYEEAIKDLDRALAVEPQGRAAGFAYRARGVARAGLGQIPEADLDFQESMRLAPDNAWLYYSLAKALEGLKVRGALDAEKKNDAFGYYAMALRKGGPKLNRPKFLDAMASVERVTGKLSIGPEEIARVLDGPDDTILSRARSAMESGEYGLALLQAGALGSLPPAILMRCLCHRRLRDFDGADAEVEELFTSPTSPPGAFVERGYARLRKGDLDEARADFASVANVSGDEKPATEFVTGFCGLALVWLREGNLSRAGEAIQTALLIDPGNAECLWASARIREAAGDRTGAEAGYRESLGATRNPLSAWERSQVLDALRVLGGESEEGLAE